MTEKIRQNEQDQNPTDAATEAVLMEERDMKFLRSALIDFFNERLKEFDEQAKTKSQ